VSGPWEQYQQTPQAPASGPWQSYAEAQSDEGSFGGRVATQLTKGVTGLLGAPRAMADLAQAGGNYLAEQVGMKQPFPEGMSPFHMALPGAGAPTADSMNKAVFGALGVEEVNAKTPAGKILDVGMQAIPGGFVLGGASGLVPAITGGLGSEAAGQTAEAMGANPFWSAAARIGGGVAGGGLGALTQEGIKGTTQGVRNAFGMNDPQRVADKIATKAIGRDNMDPKAMAKALEDLGPGATIADVGGKNVRGTVRAAAGSPGQAGQYVDDILSQRKADEPARFASAVDRISPNRGFTDTIDDIVAQRSQKAAPLYEQAGIPKDAAQYGTAPRLASDEVKTLIAKSKDVQNAIAQAKSLPQYADLADDSMVLLDKAYKNIGGKAEAAKRSGDMVAYRDLNELRNQLKDAIVKERPAYGDALKTFADDSKLKGAIEQGRKLFSTQADAQVTAKTYSALSPDEQLLFRQGVAEAMRDTGSRSAIGSPSARAFGGPKMQDKLRQVLGSDFDEFAKDMGREATFTRTAKDVAQGSRTAPMLAEMDDLSGQVGMAKDLAKGDVMGLLLRGGSNMRDRLVDGRNEKVNEALAKMLVNPDINASKQTLSGLLDKQTAEELSRLLRQQQLLGGMSVGPAIGAQQR
jgi:hypothetical protein